MFLKSSRKIYSEIIKSEGERHYLNPAGSWRTDRMWAQHLSATKRERERDREPPHPLLWKRASERAEETGADALISELSHNKRAERVDVRKKKTLEESLELSIIPYTEQQQEHEAPTEEGFSAWAVLSLTPAPGWNVYAVCWGMDAWPSKLALNRV